MERRHLDVWRPEAIAALIVPKSCVPSSWTRSVLADHFRSHASVLTLLLVTVLTRVAAFPTNAPRNPL